MKKLQTKLHALAASALLLSACVTGPAFAETIKGRVDVVNQGNQTLVVAGITFQTTPATAYNDALKAFSNLQQGQKVTVEFDRNGSNQYTAKLISLEK